MTPSLSGHFSMFGLVLFVLNSLLGIARQWSRAKFANLTLELRSHVRILIYQTWAISYGSSFSPSIYGPITSRNLYYRPEKLRLET